MKRFILAGPIIITLYGVSLAQEWVSEVAKRVKPSVVTVVARGGNEETKDKTGSGFFVNLITGKKPGKIESVEAFARRVRERLDSYHDWRDEELVRRLLERTPEYRSRVRHNFKLNDDAPKIVRLSNASAGSFVVTNWHVVANSTSISIRTSDKKSYDVSKVVFFSSDSDLAVLQINISKEKYPALQITDAFPEEGDRVLVIGTPLGMLEGSLSDGIISSLRNVPSVGTVLQITAPVSQGSSGSPVVNSEGKVVGVVTLGLKLGQNLNFAMPWFTVARMLNPDDPLNLYD